MFWRLVLKRPGPVLRILGNLWSGPARCYSVILTSVLYFNFAVFLEAAPNLIDIEVDNHLLPASDTPPTFVSNADRIIFRFGRFNSQIGQKFFRVRYQLEGFDSDWKQARGVCQIVTIFYNSENLWIDQKSHAVLDKSEGWNEDLKQSTFSSST